MKSWLITGASSGIGRAVMEKLLARGDRVAAAVRRPGILDDLAVTYGEQLRISTFDLTDISTMRREVNDAFAALGRIDVVFSNAGFGLFGAAEEVTDEQIEGQIATNLIGSIQLVRACLPHLRRQGAGAYSRHPPRAAKRSIRASPSTMPPNGALKASSKRLPKR